MADIRPNQLPDAVAFSPDDKLIIDQNNNGVRRSDPAPFVNYVAPIATTPEATGGTNDTVRMTPLKTAQYVAGQVGNSLASNSQGAKADSAVQSVNGKSGNSITLDKSDVGLGNVDNTSDANKPVSTATQTALDGKVNTSSNRLIPSGGTTNQILAKSSNTDYATTWLTSTAATAVSYDPQTLTSIQKDQARDNINSASNDDIGFAIVYPNGGSESSPANVSINSRYVNSNPFPGHEVICVAQIKPTGYEWGDPKFIYLSATNTGAGVASSIYNDSIVTQTGSAALMGASSGNGSPFGFTAGLDTPTPCRVLVWKVK